MGKKSIVELEKIITSKDTDYMTWEHYDYFIKFVRYSLTRLKEEHQGYPDSEVATDEEWTAILDEMLILLDRMDEQSYEEEFNRLIELTKVDASNHDKVTAFCQFKRQNMENAKKEFFELYCKYFYNLWD